MFCSIKSYTCSSASRLSALTQPHNRFVLPLLYCPANHRFFKFGPEICCSGVSSR